MISSTRPRIPERWIQFLPEDCRAGQITTNVVIEPTDLHRTLGPGHICFTLTVHAAPMPLYLREGINAGPESLRVE